MSTDDRYRKARALVWLAWLFLLQKRWFLGVWVDNVDAECISDCPNISIMSNGEADLTTFLKFSGSSSKVYHSKDTTLAVLYICQESVVELLNSTDTQEGVLLHKLYKVRGLVGTGSITQSLLGRRRKEGFSTTQ